jgi:membrane-associated phospholipid phosphatase
VWGVAAPLVLTCALYAFAVGTDAGREAENDVFINPSPAGDRLWSGLISTVSPWACALAGGLVAALAWRAHGRRGATAVIVLLVGSNVTTYVVSRALARVDPLGGEGYRVFGEGFFPSGHATAAASLGAALVLAAPAARRVPVAAAAIAYPAAVGVALVAAAGHHVSDVVAGMLVVTAWGAVARTLAASTPAAVAGVAVAAACGALGGIAVPVLSGVPPREHLDLVLACAVVIWTAFAAVAAPIPSKRAAPAPAPAGPRGGDPSYRR